MRRRRAPTSARKRDEGRGGREGRQREINEIPFARAGAIQPLASRLVGSIEWRRGCERDEPTPPFLSSLFAAEASYYGVISTPPVILPSLPRIAVLNSHIVTLRDPDQVQSRMHSGGGYCNFYRWTGVHAVTRKKSDLYEMTRPIAPYSYEGGCIYT